MQICRRGYTVKDNDSNIELVSKTKYIMSPKDLKTIHFMNKMMDAGVRVFKIEGRARGPEYVRIVTECYKEAVKAYCNGTYDEEKIAVWDERLKSVFNRGFWDGYYLDSVWANGAANTVPARPRRRCMWQRALNISAASCGGVGRSQVL